METDSSAPRLQWRIADAVFQRNAGWRPPSRGAVLDSGEWTGHPPSAHSAGGDPPWHL